MTESLRQKFKDHDNEESIYGDKYFLAFLRDFSFQKFSQTLECAFNAVELHFLKSLKAVKVA